MATHLLLQELAVLFNRLDAGKVLLDHRVVRRLLSIQDFLCSFTVKFLPEIIAEGLGIYWPHLLAFLDCAVLSSFGKERLECSIALGKP